MLGEHTDARGTRTLPHTLPTRARKDLYMSDAFSSKALTACSTPTGNLPDYRIESNTPRPPIVIRISDRRNRLKQEEQRPRCSSVPVSMMAVPMDRKNTLPKEHISRLPTTEIQATPSRADSETDTVSFGKERGIIDERKVYKVQIQPMKPNVPSGKPPPLSQWSNQLGYGVQVVAQILEYRDSFDEVLLLFVGTSVLLSVLGLLRSCPHSSPKLQMTTLSAVSFSASSQEQITTQLVDPMPVLLVTASPPRR
ncbi:hypothetical protein Aperf_G00000103672 [Anoplocephala perfoliata]